MACGEDALSRRPLSVTRSEFSGDIFPCLHLQKGWCELLLSVQIEKVMKADGRRYRQCQQQIGDICAGLTSSIKYWESHQTRNQPLPRSSSMQMQHISADERRVWTNVAILLTHPSDGTSEGIDSLTMQGDVQLANLKRCSDLTRCHDTMTRMAGYSRWFPALHA